MPLFAARQMSASTYAGRHVGRCGAHTTEEKIACPGAEHTAEKINSPARPGMSAQAA